MFDFLKTPKSRGFETYDTSKWSFYKAGWRPALGWLSFMIILLAFVIKPLIIIGLNISGSPVILDKTDFDAIINLVYIIIGLGTMRTVEKLNQVDQEPKEPKEPKKEEEQDA